MPGLLHSTCIFTKPGKVPQEPLHSLTHCPVSCTLAFYTVLPFLWIAFPWVVRATFYCVHPQAHTTVQILHVPPPLCQASTHQCSKYHNP